MPLKPHRVIAQGQVRCGEGDRAIGGPVEETAPCQHRDDRLSRGLVDPEREDVSHAWAGLLDEREVGTPDEEFQVGGGVLAARECRCERRDLVGDKRRHSYPQSFRSNLTWRVSDIVAITTLHASRRSKKSAILREDRLSEPSGERRVGLPSRLTRCRGVLECHPLQLEDTALFFLRWAVVRCWSRCARRPSLMHPEVDLGSSGTPPPRPATGWSPR